MRFAALAAAVFAASVHAAPPPAFLKATDSAALPAAADVPPELAPAFYAQMILLKIRAGEPVEKWRAEMSKLAAETGDKPMTAGLRDLALCWEARARMAEIDGALRAFYRDAVRFPDKLSQVSAAIPKSAATDPWGEEWAYSPAAPAGFSAKYVKQRYQLGPKRQPQLATIAEARRRAPKPPAWKIALQNVGGARAVTVTAANGQRAVLQGGGQVAGIWVLHIGDGWLLAADSEWLFAVPF